MNIYLIVEDGEERCIKAKTMKEAIDICLNSYLEEMQEGQHGTYMESTEKEHYYDNILYSCSLVGRLWN